jgi:hypothetical protein
VADETLALHWPHAAAFRALEFGSWFRGRWPRG